jgi:hypothetical protein
MAMRSPFDETPDPITSINVSDLDWSDYVDTVPVPAFRDGRQSLYGAAHKPSMWPARTARIASAATLLALGWGLPWFDTIAVAVATFLLIVLHKPRATL